LLLIFPARAVILGQLLIRRIDALVVTTGFGDAGFKVADIKMELNPPN
jgi:hypothetical protein